MDRLFLKSFAAALLATAPVLLQAQLPAKCFEIESILVDACISATECPNSQEGQNEMVRFRTGPDPIALSGISVDWPNNTWRGLVQDASTASLTAALNGTIQACGLLLEPPGGVIPPGSGVLMVTSTQMCVPANSFTNLGDTLYIVFQQPGNTAGHFANHNNGNNPSPTPTGTSALRTLVMTYTPTSCGDTATYDRALLVNSQGTYGGPSALNDGATAQFSWPGTPVVTYVNFGCQAPFVPVTVQVEATGNLCNGSTVQLNAVATGAAGAVQWTGGSGTFSDANALSTSYTAGPQDAGTVTLQVCVGTSCGDPVCDTVQLPVGNAPVVTITADGPLSLCAGEQLQLTATGADTYAWNTGGTTAVLVVAQPGTYSVSGTNACGTANASVVVTAGQAPEVTVQAPDTLCAGSTATLVAGGADSYTWNTGATGAQLTVNAGGTYTVTGSTACGSAQVTVVVASASAPQLSISGDTFLCAGSSGTLTVSGGGPYLWNTGATTAVLPITAPGTYSASSTNSCGTSSVSVVVVEGQPPVVAVTGDAFACPTSTLAASGANTYAWSTGQSTPTITVDAPGTYTVTGSNACGSSTAAFTVQNAGVSAVPSANITQGPAPLTVQFGSSSTPQGAQLGWSFGDGATATGAGPVHTFNTPGTYTVVHTASANGCSDAAELTITVLQPDRTPSRVNMPNVFSPNGDGVNDLFQVDSEGLATLELEVLNRWGQVVITLRAPEQAWDGRTAAGEAVPEGTYFVVLTATGMDGVRHERTAALTLLR